MRSSMHWTEEIPRFAKSQRPAETFSPLKIFYFVNPMVSLVGLKVAFPEVDPHIICGIAVIGFVISLLVQQWFNSTNVMFFWDAILTLF